MKQKTLRQVPLMAVIMMTETMSAQLNDSLSIDSSMWYNQSQQLREVVIKSRLPKTKLTGNLMITRIKGSNVGLKTMCSAYVPASVMFYSVATKRC